MSKASELLKQLRTVNEQAGEIFLPKSLVMVDLEMTGVIPERDDVLQVAMLKLELQHMDPRDYGYLVKGEPLELFIHSDKKPSNDFHREFLVDIFDKANNSDLSAEEAKTNIHDWLGDLKGLATPCGDAVHNDLMFLYAKGLIDRGDIVNNKSVPGSFHYEVFDLNGLKCLSRQANNGREELELEDGIHNAMVDCRNQLKELNWYLKILLNERP